MGLILIERRTNPVNEVLVMSKGRAGADEPAVPENSLGYIIGRGSFHE